MPQPEHNASIGASITVSLLKNGGKKFNNSTVEVAEIDEDIAVQTTRLVKSQRTFEGVKTYILLQRARSRVATRQEGLRVIQAIEKEIRMQVNEGLRNGVELTEAQARVSEQSSALIEARQDLNEQVGAFQIFFTALNGGGSKKWVASDSLKLPSASHQNNANFSNLDNAFVRRPETKIYALKIEREEVLRLVAENQAKPELNLRADISKTQLSDKYIPFRNVFSTSNPYQSWRVGFEYRRGLGGNIQERSEYKKALLREKQAELTMHGFRQRIASELNGIGSIFDRSRDQVRDQSQILQAKRSLATAARNKRSDGGSSSIDTLTRDLEVILAREGYNDAVAQLNLSSYLASQVSGTLLSRLGIE